MTSHTLYHLEELIKFRHELHAMPEIAFEEHETSKKLKAFLIKIGVPESFITECTATGFYVDIPGQGEPSGSPLTVACRADIDGLPQTEDNPDLDYCSKNGRAHSCGHDGHMTMLLGFACLYMENIKKIPSNKKVRLLFQPAEEGCSKTNKGGASEMIKLGCLEGVDEVYGAHNWPTHKPGTIMVKPGPMMAEVIMVKIKVLGVGWHGSEPHKAIDPLQPAVDIYIKARELIERYKKENLNFTFSLPMIKGSAATNIIPDTAELGGTFRSLEKGLYERFKKEFTAICEECCSARNCKLDLYIQNMYPILFNTEKEALFVEKVAKDLFGEEHAGALGVPVYASEDFSYFTEQRPGAYFFVGSAREGRTTMLHQRTYNFNDEALDHGSKFWMKLIETRFDRE
jgi:hippurate hydrolase